MKHLYIIGNGFDLFTGLHTSYSDFKRWIQHEYIFVYENMEAAYNMEGEWWNNFEINLGELDIHRYIHNFTPPEKSKEEIIKHIEDRNKHLKNTKLPSGLHPESPCANRLRGLLDILQYCFERWVENCQSMITNPIYTHIEKADSYFINFNYTDTIEWLYKIPDERVLHIHGRASKHDRLIFGHNKCLHGGIYDGVDVNQTCLELSRYQKNPYEHLSMHKDLPDILSHVEFVHVFGLSLSPVDVDYMDWIEKNTPRDCNWEFSWFTELDMQRIKKFVLNHWRIKNRYRSMQLQPTKGEEKLDFLHQTHSMQP